MIRLCLVNISVAVERRQMPEKNEVTPVRFESISRKYVPQGRNGKHKDIILELLAALKELQRGSALKIALDELPDSKENIRAALSRATKQRNIEIGTSSDDEHFYVWKLDQCV
jgi:TusA-related sulfurtransferase